MKRLSAAIIQPTIIAMGASIFLYSYNHNLEVTDYFLHVPFWIGIVRPSGLYWQQTILKQINKGVFPPQMKVYREMYLASKNAILYDVVLNHTLYHSLLTTALISYMYGAKTFIGNTKEKKRNMSDHTEKKLERNGLGAIFKESIVTLIQGRVLISCASILSEYGITYSSLKKQGSSSTYSLPSNVKRLLMAKQMLLNWSWSGLILKEFFRLYQKRDQE